MRRYDQADVLWHEFSLVHDLPDAAPQLYGPPEPLGSKLSRYYDAVHALPDGQSALCLSGGGIRSAAFCLGVLQGLARRRLLSQFDYLSTVSGGGYIGSWLTAWAHRATLRPTPGGFDEVERLVAARPPHAAAEVPPIHWLRRNQRFLTPRSGMTSGDSWAGAALFIRDLLLNWLVFLPAILALLLLPRLLELVLVWWAISAGGSGSGLGWLLFQVPGPIHEWLFVPGDRLAPPNPRGWVDMAGAFFTFLAMAGTFLFRTSGPSLVLSDRGFTGLVLLPLLIGGWLIVMAATVILAGGAVPDTALLVICAAGTPLTFLAARLMVLAITGVLDWMRVAGAAAEWGRVQDVLWDVVCLLGAGLTTGGLIWLGLWIRSDAVWGKGTVRDLAVFGVPFLLLSFVAGQIVYAALACRAPFGRRDQEWMGRAAGFYLLAATAWALVCGIVVYGQPLRAELISAAALFGISGTLTLATAASAFTKATKTLAAAREKAPVSVLVQAGAALFIGSGAVLLSQAVEWLVWLWSGLDLETRPNELVVLLAQHWVMLTFSISEMAKDALTITAETAAALMGVSLLLSLVVDVNTFSLHALYRNRLVRTFLGASNVPDVTGAPNQRNRFSGFSDNDDLLLNALWRRGGPGETATPCREGPYPVVNMALNLVGGKDAAWQDRKAAPFVATPFHLGGALVGYVEHDATANRRHLSLGTAMAISGAAASPNWGYHSSPLVGFIMMLFNIRLGWWLENPSVAKGDGRGGLLRSLETFLRFAGRSMRLFTQEALGQTGANDPYVYLSDGGHFDNLGIYEMLRRRCRTVVAVDASQDQFATLDDLGRTLRQASIDLGIVVEFDRIPFQKRTDPASAGFYATTGVITYPEGGPKGILIYIKPGFLTDAPADVRAYAAADPNFPHDSTLNQWFTESQFESYRALGLHVLGLLCGPVRTKDARLEMSELPHTVETYLRRPRAKA